MLGGSMDYTSSYRGKVRALHEDYDDGNFVRVEVEELSPPKRKGKKGMAMSVAETRSHTLPKAQAAHFAIGDKVTCTATIAKNGGPRKLTRKGKNPGKDGY